MLPNLTTLLTALAALAVVLGLVWLAARAARLAGLGPRAGGGHLLHVVESVALDPRRRLHLVACAEGRVLLLTGGSADLVVGWLSPSADAGRPGRQAAPGSAAPGSATP